MTRPSRPVMGTLLAHALALFTATMLGVAFGVALGDVAIGIALGGGFYPAFLSLPTTKPSKPGPDPEVTGGG